MQVRGELILASLLLVGLIIKESLYFVASNCLCRFSSALTDVHMDTSTKLATFSLEEEVLTEYIPKHVKLCGL